MHDLTMAPRANPKRGPWLRPCAGSYHIEMPTREGGTAEVVVAIYQLNYAKKEGEKRGRE